MQFFVDGVPLKDPNRRWNVMVGTAVTSPITKRNASVTVPGVSGVRRSIVAPFEAPQVPIELRIYGINRDDMQANWSALMGVLDRGEKLVRVTDNISQSADMELVSVAEPDYNVVQSTLTARALVRLNSVFWKSDLSVFTGAVCMNTVTTLDVSTAPITDLEFRIKGPITDPTIFSGSTWVKVSETLSGSDYLVISCADFTARKGAADWDSGGTSVVLETSGGPYALVAEPDMQSTDPRETEIVVTLAGSGTSGATEFYVRGRTTWI